MEHELLIIGGGASGLMAAITAKDLGIDAAVLEGTDRVGKKLLTTGNGRCNITNRYISPERYHSAQPGFFNECLQHFGVKECINFFKSIGLPLITLEEGKMYPMSLQASSVLDIMRLALEDRNIPVYLSAKVKGIRKEKGNFHIFTEDGSTYSSQKLILATGGKSAAATGSDGSGFKLACSLGHHLVSPIPALVQLKLDYKHLKALSGIRFNGVVEISVNHVDNCKEFGEVLFTDYGISGPPVLQLSRIASSALVQKLDTSLTLDMMYSYSMDELEDFLESHWAIFSYRSIMESFIGIVHKKIIPILLKEAGITDIHRLCYTLEWMEKKKLFQLLKSWQFKVIDTNAFANAQVTAGGVDTSEIDANTLESKIVPDLYFAGEVIDVDGDCGGFNLQWAWSSGFLAAQSAHNK